MSTTTLQELLNRMNAYTPIANLSEVIKVNAIDQSIRAFRMSNQPPWTLQKTTLRVFINQELYPVPTDFERVAIIDDQLGQDSDFGQHPRYTFTSLRDFLEDPSGGNAIAEVWQGGTRFIGCRNNTNPGMTQALLENPSVAADWAGSGDAGTPVLDNVIFRTGSTSIRVPITFSSGTATVLNTFQVPTIDANYKTKYFFCAVYLATTTVPSSILINLRTNASNYLSATVTTQFAGQPLVANDWNVLAIDLNTAAVTGTVTGTFRSVQYVFTETVGGNCYFDASFLKGWILQDFWYYSTYNVLNSSTYQEYFAPDSATYTLSSVLLGDTAWHDPIMYEACTYLLSDQKESAIFGQVSALRDRAWGQFFQRYPDESPQITTDVYRFGTDYQDEMGWPDLTMRG